MLLAAFITVLSGVSSAISLVARIKEDIRPSAESRLFTDPYRSFKMEIDVLYSILGDCNALNNQAARLKC